MVQKPNSLIAFYQTLSQATMTVAMWNWFIKALSLAFIAYWLHLSHGLNDWLGTTGFHLSVPGSSSFAPLSSPWPLVLWWLVLAGGLLMFFQRTAGVGSMIAGCGFFYTTICDNASTGALNMHFLFALAMIFWSAGLIRSSDRTMSAWPAYLIRLYLVVVYFGSGWRKAVYGDWLSNPNALLHCMTGFFTSDLTRLLYPVIPLFVWTVVQYLTVGFELGAPLLLLYPPLRRYGVILGCLLHVGIALLMKDLFFFSFQMLTFYIPVLIPTSYLPTASSKSGHQSAI